MAVSGETEKSRPYDEMLAEELHDACWDGDTARVSSLLEQGADPNQNTGRDISYGGEMPLCAACRSGNLECVELMVNAGAIINCRGFDACTPLMGARYEKHVDIIRYLLAHGADPTIPDSWGIRPLRGLDPTHSDKDWEIICLLVEHGADVNMNMHMICDGYCTDKSMIWYVCNVGMVDRVRYLLEHEADATKPDLFGVTPMAAARAKGHMDCVSVLQEYGVEE